MPPRVALALAIVLAFVIPINAQAPPVAVGMQRPGLPPRDNAQPVSGTGRIRGRVVATETGVPLRRAQVVIASAEPTLRRMATTDGDGRYEFAELPAARYTISVTKGGYVSLQYGQRRPFEPGRPLALADGQTLSQVDVALPRGSVITGRITDEFGEPVTGANVMAQRYQYGPGGVRRLSFVAGNNFITTDDLGQFRLFGLMPGEYVISATMRTFGGATIGPGLVADSSEGFPQTFYPGTTNAAEAEAVTVGLAQDLTLQFAMRPARLSRLSGTVVDSQGRPASGAMVSLRTSAGGGMMSMGLGQVQADGSFAIPNVSPGEYVVDVRSMPRPASLDRASEAMLEVGSVPVTVGDADISGLRIATTPGARISGHVTFDGTAATTGGFGPTRVMATPANPQDGMMAMMAGDPFGNGTINDDGSFQLRGVSGSVLFRVTAPAAWTVKSVTLDGDDITDVPLDVAGRDAIGDLRIVLTDRLTDLGGSVVDSRKAPVKDYAVVLLPEEPVEGMAAARFTRVARPDQDGRYRVRGLPPGRYLAAAVEVLEQGREWDPEFQQRMRQRARQFAMKEGEAVTLDLTVSPDF